MTHGTFNGYRKGCRCDECRRAKAEHAARYPWKPKPKRAQRVSRRPPLEPVASLARPSVSRALDRTPRVPGPQPENFHGLAHGASSDRLVIPDAEQLAEIVYEGNQHLTERDRPAVLDYSIAQIRAWRFAHYLERLGDFDSKGRVRPAVEYLRRWLQPVSYTH